MIIYSQVNHNALCLCAKVEANTIIVGINVMDFVLGDHRKVLSPL